jgi:hypothetical protein
MAVISSIENYEIVGFLLEQQKQLSDFLASSKEFSTIASLAPLCQ